MTKEEIESKFEDAFQEGTYPTLGGYGADMTDRDLVWESFKPHLDQYAKQDAIGFIQWIGHADYQKGEKGWMQYHDEETLIATDEELYDEYIQSKKQ